MENSAPHLHSEATAEETEIDRILGEVARRHRIIVSPSDPMVVVLTMFELVLARYLQQTDSALLAQRAAMSRTIETATATAKAVAQALVTAAADYHVKTTKAAIDEAAANINRASNEALEKIHLAARNARWLLWLSWGSIAIMIAIGFGVWIGILISPEIRKPPSPRCNVDAAASVPSFYSGWRGSSQRQP
jgi:hypothetical protein